MRRLLYPAIVAAATISQAAVAAPGVAISDVNMRTGPGTGYPVITTIPGGAPVEVLGCQSWCSVVYRGAEGYVSGRYLQTQVAGGYQAAPPVAYVYQSPMPPRAYWRYRQPWWDDRYAAWYDGRYWWHDGRWYSQPSFSINFRFSEFDGDRDRNRWRDRSGDGQVRSVRPDGGSPDGRRGRVLCPPDEDCY
jgi:uncharacterized protein YraI